MFKLKYNVIVVILDNGLLMLNKFINNTYYKVDIFKFKHHAKKMELQGGEHLVNFYKILMLKTKIVKI